MNTVRQANLQTRPLHRSHLITDGNSHRPDLLPDTLPQSAEHLISEALLPQIRTIATLIAAERHDFSQVSPDVFTEEADFFAARILVLGVRRFHLDVRLVPMLKLANQRAQRFAAKHKLPFTPAQVRMSLNANRPAHLLIIETEHDVPTQGNIITDTLAFAAKLPRL